MVIAISIISFYLLLQDNRRVMRFISAFLLVYVVSIILLEQLMQINWAYAVIAFCFLFLQLIVGLNFLTGKDSD